MKIGQTTPAELAVVLLGAGYGTRLKSDLIKVLHPVAGKPMLAYAMDLAQQLTPTKPVVVVGHQAEKVQAFLGDRATYVMQHQRLGTGHAVLQAKTVLKNRALNVLVLYGDMPLLTQKTLKTLWQMHKQQKARLSMLTVVAEEPMGFGRILRNPDTHLVEAIVEETQATEAQKAIRELNVGVYCFEAEWLWEHLEKIELSPKGEYYLTDLIEMATRQGLQIQTLITKDVQEVQGINTQAQLERANRLMEQKIKG